MYVQSKLGAWMCRSQRVANATAAKALDTLRGLQGVGTAAIIPASVSEDFPCLLFTRIDL